jgi:acetyltransferase-like isoleucine patch superfamily enzyme
VFKILLQLSLFILPWPLRRRLLNALFGFKIAPSARVGLSLVICRNVELGEGAKIGHLSIVKGLTTLRLGRFAHLGNLNWVTGFPERSSSQHFANCPYRKPELVICDHASITHRHLIDCTDSVLIGAFSTLAGWGSQIFTHAIDFEECRQTSAPVRIGEYCFVGTRAVLLKGVNLPTRSVLAAGSVLATPMNQAGMIYCGVPALAVKPVNGSGKYFTRSIGFVR